MRAPLLLLVIVGPILVATLPRDHFEDPTSCSAPRSGNGHGAAMSQFRAQLKEESVRATGEDPTPGIWAASAMAAAAAAKLGEANLAEQQVDNTTQITESSSWSSSNTTEAGSEWEANLTQQVHQQARVVAKAAGRLLHTNEKGNKTVDKLETDYREKKREADIAEMEYEQTAKDLEQKKAGKERLRDATQAAEQALWRLQKEYMEAEQAYQEVRRTAQVAQDAAEQKTDAKDNAERTMHSTVTKISYETNDLQDNIGKLNDLNEDLKQVQSTKGFAARDCSGVATLLLCLCLVTS